MKKGLIAFFYAISLVLVFLAASIAHARSDHREAAFSPFATESNYGKIVSGI